MSLAGTESQAMALTAGCHPSPCLLPAYLSLSLIQLIAAMRQNPHLWGLPVGWWLDMLSRTQAVMLDLRKHSKMRQVSQWEPHPWCHCSAPGCLTSDCFLPMGSYTSILASHLKPLLFLLLTVFVIVMQPNLIWYPFPFWKQSWQMEWYNHDWLKIMQIHCWGQGWAIYLSSHLTSQTTPDLCLEGVWKGKWMLGKQLP